MGAPPIDPRPLRADARRNREAILKAAAKVFARRGVDAQMDDVARGAGVGVGTVYRHFPTKEALLDALVVHRVEQIARFAEEALEEPDAWEGLCRTLWRAAELSAPDLGFCQMFNDRARAVEAAQAAHAALEAGAGELLRRAQRAGQARPDLEPRDIPIVMSGVIRAMHGTGDTSTWKRHLRICLDGMSARAAGDPLPDG